MDSKHSYASRFPSPNKVAWQENPVQLSSVAPNSHKQAVEDVEDSTKITTTPVCDVSTFLSNLIIMEFKKYIFEYNNIFNNGL